MGLGMGDGGWGHGGTMYRPSKDVTKHHTTHKFATLYGFRNLQPGVALGHTFRHGEGACCVEAKKGAYGVIGFSHDYCRVSFEGARAYRLGLDLVERGELFIVVELVKVGDDEAPSDHV
eukprot:scaffold12068_cov104-Isochrysis_galbana.AAC.3